MPRIARIVVPEYPHHITHRGNYKQVIFEEESDYIFYSQLVEKYFQKNRLKILSYVLMPNHVHFILIPREKDSLARAFNVTQMVYAQYMNEKKSTTGHLWGNRYYSCVLDPAHLYRAIRYVERNPVRAGLVRKAWEWSWSSAKEHVTAMKGLISLADISEFIKVDDWKKYLSQDDEEYNEGLRKHTRTGKPIGEVHFLKQLEKILNISFSSGPGRSKKSKSD
jgi:putative transposase